MSIYARRSGGLHNTDYYCSQALQYQGPQALDAILNYPMYNALVSAFAIPGSQNMSALTDMISQIKRKSTVSGVSAAVGCRWLLTDCTAVIGPHAARQLP